MPQETWIEYVGSESDPKWVDSERGLALTLEYDEEHDHYSITLQHRKHLPPRDLREVGRSEDEEEAYQAVEELLESEELEEIVEDAGQELPEGLSY